MSQQNGATAIKEKILLTRPFSGIIIINLISRLKESMPFVSKYVSDIFTLYYVYQVPFGL